VRVKEERGGENRLGLGFFFLPGADQFARKDEWAMVNVVLLLAWIGQSCFTLQVGETRIVLDPVPPGWGILLGRSRRMW
jgi:hypothetical protein